MVDEVITKQELIDAKRDAQDLGKAVNEKVIVSPRYGGDFKSLPMIAEEFQDAIETAAAAGAGANGWTDLLIQTVDGSTQRAKNELFQGQINGKAGKAYVDSQDALLQSQIDQKAPAAYLDAALDEQTQTVNTALSQLSTQASKFYPTLAEANTDITNIAVNQPVQIGESGANGGLWYKATAGATSLTKSAFDPLTQAKSYTDVKTKNITEDLQDSIIASIEDKAGNVVAYFDSQSNMYLANDIITDGKSLLASIAEKNNQVRFQGILSSRDKVKSLVSVATKSEDNLIKRMPASIKTPTGLVYFYHKQIAGFDGDGTGSELWKAIISIDADLNVTVESRSLFLAPDEPRGIVKHPMLGRTSDNRIILIFEKRLEINENYTRYQCYSSDEGLTFTTPTIVSPTGINPAGATGNSALGTTGTITTAKNGRLIVPMYTTGGACYCIYSDDDGVSWTYSAWVDTTKLQGFEPSISLDMNDDLIMDVRPKTAGYRLKAKSTDNGQTWQAISTQQIPSATNQGVIFRDKTVGLMIQAHNAEQSDSRTKYSLFLSYDNCETFPFVYMPFTPTWYGGYSQIIKWSEGIYIISIEYAESFISVNNNENAGLLILSLSEVLSNVSSN